MTEARNRGGKRQSALAAVPIEGCSQSKAAAATIGAGGDRSRVDGQISLSIIATNGSRLRSAVFSRPTEVRGVRSVSAGRALVVRISKREHVGNKRIHFSLIEIKVHLRRIIVRASQPV